MTRSQMDIALKIFPFFIRRLFPALLLLTLAVLCIGLIQAGSTENSDPTPASRSTSENSTSPSLPTYPPPHDCYQEIGGFVLEGKRLIQKCRIYDLDILTSPEGDRYLPLLRLLRFLQVEYSQQGRIYTIRIPKAGTVHLDLNEKLFTRNEETSSQTQCYTAVSDISLKKDVFLPPEAIEKILYIEMEWDDLEYAYQGSTKISFPVWDREDVPSLLGITTSEIKEDIPEAHPPAYPGRRAFSLDFIKLRGRIKGEIIEGSSTDQLVLDSLEQTLWGALAGGRYKLGLIEQNFRWDENGLHSSTNPEIFPNWGEWRYINDTGNQEVVVGDNVFGLNNLTYPTLRLTGIRVSGYLGGAQDEYSPLMNPGLSTNFSKPLVFEGRALVGSHADLYINDVLIDSDEVITSLPDEPGVGKYLFENVNLSSGSVNEVRIEIIDPNEVVQVIEKRIIGTSSLLPEGELCYVSGLGTQREFNDYAAQGILAGGRLLYGLTNQLTLGGTAAYQDNYFDQDISLTEADDRRFPQQSWHLGLQGSWQFLPYSIFSGDFSYSSIERSETDHKAKDPAFRFNWQLAPLDTIDLYALYLWYGPDFFNGSNRDLRDREGYACDLDWHPHRLIALKLSGGDIWNNLDSTLQETLSINYQSAQITTRLPFYSSLSFGYDRLAPSWEDNINLLTMRLRSYLPGNIALNASYATGDDLRLDENYDFLQGLRLPGLSLFATRSTSFSLRKRLSKDWGSLALNYWETGGRERLSFIHSANFLMGHPIQMRTEAGYDIDKNTTFFENRTELPLTESKGTRLGLQARLEDREWQVSLFLSLTELLNFNRGQPALVRKRLEPEQGVLKGKVFLDKNANTFCDPGETGLQDIDILLDHKFSATSRYDGNFLISRPGSKKTVRLTLDMESIPAIYAPTHATQKVFLRENEITRVFLGLTPVHAVSGYIVSLIEGEKPQAVPGIRVYIIQAENGKDKDGSAGREDWISDSITADDGSFYLENVRPGNYLIGLDPSTIPPSFHPREKYVEVVIEPSEYPEEIKAGNIQLLSASEETEEWNENEDYANAQY